ncbi:MAG TPA: ABC transporter permease [Bryobacteraceae bacterium]|nr:ABC transporter permease [Bryobacteraceae bacterium]
MTTASQDIIYGFRALWKKPGFTIVAALSLALGIAANTVIFSLINTTLLRPLPYAAPDRLVELWSVPLDHKDQRNWVTAFNLLAFQQRAKSFQTMGGTREQVCNVGSELHGQPPERVDCENVMPSLFQTLGVKPILGRVLAEDENPVDNAAQVLVIGEHFWERHFNRDPAVIGKVMRVDGLDKTVIGVMPKNFYVFDDQADFWTPMNWTRTEMASATYALGTVARLKPGVSIRQAQAEMDTLAAQQLAADPVRNKNVGATVQPLADALYGDLRQPLLLLQGAVALVLLIGCANVAGLLLARAASRRTEIAVRASIGAGRSRIVRQLIAESLPLSVLGGLLGVMLAWVGLKLFIAAAPPGFPRLSELSIHPVVLGFTAAVAILTALVFGIVPALQASKADLMGSLKESGRSGTDGAARQHLRSALVTLQIAMALVLLIGAGLMINSFIRIESNPLGADPKNLLTFDLRFARDEAIKPVARYRNQGVWEINPRTEQTFKRVFERLQTLPGVIAVAGAGSPPISGSLGMGFWIDGRPQTPDRDGMAPQSAGYIAVTPNYFATLKATMAQGRDLDNRDTASSPFVAVINETMARKFWPNENPLGKRIRMDYVPDEPVREIVGVVKDIRMSRQQKEFSPCVYVSYLQQTRRFMGAGYGSRAGMFFILRTLGKPMGISESVRRIVADVDPNHPVANMRTVEQYLDRQVQYIHLYVLLLGIFGAIAAVLAAIGIYGVMAYSVAERTREIGIRMALGARANDIFRLVVLHALILLTIGLALGLAGSFALTGYLASALYEVKATDPSTFAAVSFLLAVVAIAASLIPTRRAVSVNPTVALRYE